MRQDSFRNRYIIKIASSLVIVLCNLLIQFILPRVFTIEEYGFYNYNLNVFTSIVVMANLSASNAFVAKYSKSNNELGLIYFYIKFVGLIALLLNIGLYILLSSSLLDATFIGQTVETVFLGLESGILIKLLSDCVSAYDAAAISRFPAVMQIILKIIISGTVFVGFLVGSFTLREFYYVQIVATFVIICILLFAVLKEQKLRYSVIEVKKNFEYISSFYTFCRPLVISTVVSQAVIIFMNWALMNYSGVTQQALFGAAWQFNALVCYIFSPYAELSKREFAVIADDKDMLENRILQALKLMMWLTSFFCMFISTTSDWLLPVLYGNKYATAGLITSLIMAYTIYQSWGQITGSYFIALEQTKILAFVSVVGQMLTAVFVCIFQIPNWIFPDGLGANGIAINYSLANFITTNISVGVIFWSLDIKIGRMWSIQFFPIILCGVVSKALFYIINTVNAQSDMISLVFKILISGAIYTIFIGSIVLKKPTLLGINSPNLIEKLSRKIKE